MKFFVAVLVSAGAAYAQPATVSVSSRSAVDINGNRVAEGSSIQTTKSKTGVEVTERMQSLNGRSVPVERVEERVLRDDQTQRVVERLIRAYSPDGTPATPVREMIDEQKRPDGGSTIHSVTYRGNVNGNMELVEKSTTEVHKSGSSQNEETVVERPTLNGSLETVEKRNRVKVTDGNNYREDLTTYRRDGNGGFGVAVRQTTEHREQGQQVSENTAEYELGPDGRLHLHGQTTSTAVKKPDGSKDVEVNIFGRSVPGTATDNPDKMKLYEQQLIGRRLQGDAVVETLQVRRPTVSDPNTLGPPRQVSETICRGKCEL